MKKTLETTSLFMYVIASIAALGGFLFGYDTGVISGALIFIRKTFSVTLFQQEVIVSSAVLGALLGAVFSGKLADHYGRRCMLLLTALAFIAGTLISSFAFNVTLLILGRFIVGIAIGISSFVTPLFISEMAPAHKRGALVLLNGIMITGGEAVSFLVDYALVPTQSWRLMFATGLIPAVLLFVGMIFMPSTPRWLALKGYTEKAKSTLALIRKNKDISEEFAGVLNTLHVKQAHWREIFSKKYRYFLFIGIMLGVLQQFVGINTVMYYGPTIFQAAGFAKESGQVFATFGMGIVNTLMTLAAILLVDKIGRRRLLLWGLFVAGVSLGFTGFLFTKSSYAMSAWLMLFFLILYIAGYSVSIGSLFWLIISEIYPLRVRGFAMSFVTAVQWGANFMVSITFLSILDAWGPTLTFWGYGAVCLLGMLFCYSFVPETKGVSLEELEETMKVYRPRSNHPREYGEPSRTKPGSSPARG